MAFADSSNNALQTAFVEGGGVIGENGGATRPNYVAGCDRKSGIPNKPGAHLTKAFNTACITVPSPWQFGNEPRVDPVLRNQGIDSTDVSAAKDVVFHERYRLDFRAEFFNVFNWTQFGAPGNHPDSVSSFGKITKQQNQPRLGQFSMRFTF